MRLTATRILSLIIIVTNVIFFAVAIYYYNWFYSALPEVILDRYINSIKSGEGQLTIRLTNNFDWTLFWARPNQFSNEYDRFLAKTDKFSKKAKLGKVEILSKKFLNNKVEFKVKIRMGRMDKKGEIILIQTRSEGWRIFEDNMFLGISGARS